MRIESVSVCTGEELLNKLIQVIPILIVLSDMKQTEAFVRLGLLLLCNAFFENFHFNGVLHFGRNEFRIE